MSTRGGFEAPDRPRPKAAPRPARSGDSPQPWTATRCQRLLRPLISRITTLRKDIAVSSSNPPDQTPGTQRTSTKRHSGNCDWLLPNKKARLHRTYSQRRSQGSAQREAGPDGTTSTLRTAKLRGEIIPPTPLLRRAGAHTVSSARNPGVVGESRQVLQDVSQAGDSKVRKRQTLPLKQLDDRLAALKPGLPPGRHSDYEAIYRSLEALLAATNAKLGEGEKRGPRSFLDMCLRKVPRYIAELEAWERSEAEQNGTYSALENMDTSMHIYDYLESLGAGQGWRHLRVVVRADGVKALKDAVAEGMFDDAFLELLVDLCMVTGAPREAEELLEAMVQRQYPGPDNPDTSFAELAPTQPLSALWSYATKAGRSPFLLRQHTLLLSDSNLPHDWLGTREFERIWNLAIQDISKAGAADEAVEFMIRSISLLCTRKRRPGGRGEQLHSERELSAAGQQALASALATVAAMSSLSEHEMRSPHPGSEAGPAEALRVWNRLRYILQASLAEVGTSNRSQAVVGTRLLHLALFLSSAECQDEKVVSTVKESIEAIDRSQRAGNYDDTTSARGGDRLRQQYDAMISLISSTARSRARGLAVPSHDCLDALFRQLGQALGLAEVGVLGRLKAAAAFTLAQQTHNVRDLIYAEKLNPGSSSSAMGGTTRTSEMGGRDSPNEELQARPLFAGYRWDASIGEWVTVSPVKQRPRPLAAGRRLLRSSTGGLGLRSHRQALDQERSPPRDQGRLPAPVKIAVRSGDTGSHSTAKTSYHAARGRLGPDNDTARAGCVRRRHSSCPQEVGRNRIRATGPIPVHCDPITPPRTFRHIYMSTTHPDSPKTASEPAPAPARKRTPAPAPLSAPATSNPMGARPQKEDPQQDELGHAEEAAEGDNKENRGRAGRRGGQPRLKSAPTSAKRLSVLAASARAGHRPRSLSLLRRSVASMSGDVSSEDELGL